MDRVFYKITNEYLGSLNIKDSENIITTIALMQEMVENEGDAWEYMLKKQTSGKGSLTFIRIF